MIHALKFGYSFTQIHIRNERTVMTRSENGMTDSNFPPVPRRLEKTAGGAS